MSNLKDLIAKANSEEMLENELKKFEKAKAAHLIEVSNIEKNIISLTSKLKELEASYSKRAKALGDEIIVAEKTRNAIRVEITALRSKKEKEISDLDIQIADREAKREEILVDHGKLKDEIDLKLKKLKEAEIKHKDNVATLEKLTAQLKKDEETLATQSKTSTKEIEERAHALKKQTAVAQADANTLRKLIGENETLLKSIKAQNAEQDQILAKIKSAEKKVAELDAREKDLVEREEALKIKAQDVKELADLQQAEKESLETQRLAVEGQIKRMLRKEKQLKEARYGQN